jgi:polar amino acid transport system substrate-binding protein
MTHPKLRATLGALSMAGVLLLSACSQGDTSSSSSNELGTISPGVLKVGTLSDSKPQAYTEDGELKGFDIELVRKIGDKLGLEVTFVTQELATLFPAVANESIDMAAAGTSITDERAKVVAFSDTYLIGYIAIMTTEESGITSSVDSLAGKRIGLIQGSLQDLYANDNFTSSEVVRFPDSNSSVAGLRAGTVDAVFLDSPVATQYMEQDPAFIKPITIPVEDYPVAFPINKEDTKLREAVNEALAELIASGEWLEIDEKYYPGEPIAAQFTPAGK